MRNNYFLHYNFKFFFEWIQIIIEQRSFNLMMASFVKFISEEKEFLKYFDYFNRIRWLKSWNLQLYIIQVAFIWCLIRCDWAIKNREMFFSTWNLLNHFRQCIIDSPLLPLNFSNSWLILQSIPCRYISDFIKILFYLLKTNFLTLNTTFT